MSAGGKLPTFLIIGAQKSATRWLRIHLGEHPEVFTADRELSFFSGARFNRGLGWYREQFDGWNGEPVVGEATPAYMMWYLGPARIAARIDESLPEARLMALLRDPVDRTYSAFIHHMRRGRIPPDADLLERVRSVPPERDKLALIVGGWYAESLAPYFARFGHRLRVFLHDDVAEEPEQTYAQALEHVGLASGYLPPNLRMVRHSNKPPENSLYAEQDGRKRRVLTPEERAEIYAYFSRDVDRLEGMLGRDLSVWRPS
jgi:hypothetical protein